MIHQKWSTYIKRNKLIVHFSANAWTFYLKLCLKFERLKALKSFLNGFIESPICARRIWPLVLTEARRIAVSRKRQKETKNGERNVWNARSWFLMDFLSLTTSWTRHRCLDGTWGGYLPIYPHRCVLIFPLIHVGDEVSRQATILLELRYIDCLGLILMDARVSEY